jgi:hypothetical protein
MIVGTLSLPLAESHTQFGVQDDDADASSFHVATQGQSATTQRQTKKEKDLVRKRIQRRDDKKDFAKICELLNIKLGPKKTLVHRSECL